MTKRVVLGALVGALMVVATGCTEECIDRFDCQNKRGEPGEGKQWACVDNECESQDVTPPPPPDGDAGTDGGTQTDAGTDAGTETDAGTDAGTDVGPMTVPEGGDCTANANCMAGLYCEGAAGSQKCQPLHIALTTAASADVNATDAVVVRYKAPGSEPAAGTTETTKLSASTTGPSRFPRWNKDGTAVAFVEEETGTSVTLVTRSLPLTAGAPTPLTTGANAGGTVDFRHLEWAPSASLAWSTTASSGSISGISVIPGTGGTVQTATTEGVFPSWAADGNSFVYSVNSIGLKTKVLGGAESTVAGAATSSEQPMHNQANGVLLYLDAAGNTEVISGETTPLTQLFTLQPATTELPSPAPVSVAEVSEEPITGSDDKIRSYIANHTWAPGGTHAAYVRVYYLEPASGAAVLCNGTNCGGRQGNITFVRRIDATGTPQGAEMELAPEATLPSFSPDGHFIAYLSGRKLMVQRINPEATDAASLKVGSAITHTWTDTITPSNRGDDHRPRWQPR